MDDPTYVIPLLVLGALVAGVIWVLRDARTHAGTGRPVTIYAGGFQLEKPEEWAGACLLLWVVFFPLYLKARSES